MLVGGRGARKGEGQPGQHLANFVVQLARQKTPFLLLHQQQATGKRPELRGSRLHLTAKLACVSSVLLDAALLRQPLLGRVAADLQRSQKFAVESETRARGAFDEHA